MTSNQGGQGTAPALFHHLPLAVQKTLLGQSQSRVLQAGEWLFRSGEPADYFFVVKTGRIALYVTAPQHGEILTDEVGMGQVLGVSWLVPPFQFCHDARALQDSLLLQIDALAVRQRMEDDDALSLGLYQQFRPMMARYLARPHRPLPRLYRV